MLKITLDKKASILSLEPQLTLEVKDFEKVAQTVDPFIKEKGHLNGIIIYVKTFQGWNSFAALVKHFTFIKEHHKKVSYIAFVTDSLIGDLAEHIGSHFVSAKVKHFPFAHLEEAKEWMNITPLDK